MAVRLRNGAVFLHIPKTGGSWVTQVLREAQVVRCTFSHMHADIDRTVNFVRYYPHHYVHNSLSHGPGWSRGIRESYKFIFVRDPLVWLESWWTFMCDWNWKSWTTHDRHGHLRWHPVNALDRLGDPDFNRFIENVICYEPGFVTNLYARYIGPEVNFIGRQETLVEDLLAVCNECGVDIDEHFVRSRAPVNARSQFRSPPVWDPSLRLEVTRLEYAGLVRFGYVDGSTAAEAPDAR